jgi:D-alanyl-D-alanine endopeptidase (penicillin-binding protein 7)
MPSSCAVRNVRTSRESGLLRVLRAGARVALMWMLCIASAIAAEPPADALAFMSGTPDLRSASVLILDEANARVLYQRQAEVAIPIASITKLMTALVVLDAGQPLDEIIEITKDDTNTVKGAWSRLPVGARVSRGDLLHIALMASENRAAHALGRSYPGGLTAFMRAMNAKAKALNMHSARFVDPTGLSAGNVASPFDLAELVVAAARNPTVREYSTDSVQSVAIGRGQLEFRNTNSLVSNPDWHIIVQKTGYLAEAGRCLVLETVIGGRELVIVLLDSFGKYTRTADARRVRKWIESSLHTVPAFAAAGVQGANK